jgi:hypothetical protein
MTANPAHYGQNPELVRKTVTSNYAYTSELCFASVSVLIRSPAEENTPCGTGGG